MSQRLRAIAPNAIRWLTTVVILCFLFSSTYSSGGFDILRPSLSRLPLLAIAVAMSFLAAVLSILRWWTLIRALGIEIRFRETLRLGFLAEAVSLITIGDFGGDIFKGVALVRSQPGCNARALSSVLMDRAVGFLGIFLLASMAIILSGSSFRGSTPLLETVCRLTFLVTGVGIAVFLVALSPLVASNSLARYCAAIPYVGSTLEQFVCVALDFQRQKLVLLQAVLLSMLVHLVIAFSLFLVATTLTIDSPTIWDHAVVGPLATTTCALPLPMEGLGAFEYALDELYRQLPTSSAAQRGQGLIVALAYRAVAILVAGVGLVIYFASGREEVRAAQESATDASFPSQLETVST